MVEDLRVRQTCIFKAIGTNGDIIRNNNTIIENFKNAVFQVVSCIDDPRQLKMAIDSLLYGFIKDQKARDEDVNQNIKQEYENQKKYLENSMHSLKKRIEVEGEIHKGDNKKVMDDNIDLIK